MNKFVGYRCSLCNSEYLPGQVTYTCPKDGGNLDVVLDYEAIQAKYQPEDIVSRTDFSLWRYLPMLPVAEYPGDGTPLHAVGWSPVFGLARLGNALGIKNLWLKDESGNPTSQEGTSSNPFVDVAGGLAAANPGDIVLMRSGSYDAITINQRVFLRASRGNVIIGQ